MSIVAELEPIFEEFLDLLGQLAGNEAAWSLLDSEENRQLNDGWTLETGYFTIPGTYGFETPALYVAMAPTHPDFWDSPVTNADREQILQDAITQVWEESKTSWVESALKIVYQTASQNVAEPDADKLSGSVSELSLLTQWLGRQLEPEAGWNAADDPSAPEWLRDLEVHWPATSASSESFYDFWNGVNDKCGLYLHASARLTATCAQVAATISDYQLNLRKTVESARDRARLALERWQAWKDDSGAWPTGEVNPGNDALGGVLGAVSFWSGVVSLFPVVDVVAGPVSVVTGGLSYIVAADFIESELVDAATASDLHNGLMADIKAIDLSMLGVLDSIHTEPPGDGSTTGSVGFQSYAADVVANHRDWSPPLVSL